MNLVAVTPIPPAPKMINKPMVERTMPNSPNCSFPKIRAQMMPVKKTKNFPRAVPVNDQKAPLIIRLAMSEAFNRLYKYSTSNKLSTISGDISYRCDPFC